MIPLATFGSDAAAADLFQQVRWRDGVECPRCRSDRTIKYGSYREYQRYRCKDCARTFNDKTGTIFAHSKLGLSTDLFVIYAFLRFNVSLRQIRVELDVTYEAIYRRIARFTRALDAPRLDLVGPVEIDEVYVTAGLKARERDQPSRSRGRSTRGRGTYETDNPPVFVLVDRGAEQRYVIPAKSVDSSTVRLLLAEHTQESLTVYTDGFSAYDPLDDAADVQRDAVVHSDGEYVDGDAHVNTCESYASLVRRWLLPHRGISKDKLTRYLRALQLRRSLLQIPGREALKRAIDAAL